MSWGVYRYYPPSYRRPDLRLVFAPTGATYTLTAEAGSYALTGTAAALKFNRVLAAASGSYTVTGTTTALKFNRVLVAASGSYSVSGTAVAFKRTYVMPAASGSYSVSGTVAAVKRQLTLSLFATGSVVPVSAVEVRPQLSGVISRVHVREGQSVRAGELLFTLDTRSDEANVAKLRAQIAKDQVLLADAQRQLARSRELLARNFISQGAVDSSQTAVDSQLANLQADQASLAAAQVPLSYGQIRAASAGRVGLVLGKLLDQYFEGSLWRLPAKLVLGRKKGDIVEYALKRVRSDLSRMQLMR